MNKRIYFRFFRARVAAFDNLPILFLLLFLLLFSFKQLTLAQQTHSEESNEDQYNAYFEKANDHLGKFEFEPGPKDGNSE